MIEKTLFDNIIGPKSELLGWSQWQMMPSTIRSLNYTAKKPKLGTTTYLLSSFGICILEGGLILVCAQEGNFSIRKDKYDLKDIIDRAIRLKEEEEEEEEETEERNKLITWEMLMQEFDECGIYVPIEIDNLKRGNGEFYPELPVQFGYTNMANSVIPIDFSKEWRIILMRYALEGRIVLFQTLYYSQNILRLIINFNRLIGVELKIVLNELTKYPLDDALVEKLIECTEISLENPGDELHGNAIENSASPLPDEIFSDKESLSSSFSLSSSSSSFSPSSSSSLSDSSSYSNSDSNSNAYSGSQLEPDSTDYPKSNKTGNIEPTLTVASESASEQQAAASVSDSDRDPQNPDLNSNSEPLLNAKNIHKSFKSTPRISPTKERLFPNRGVPLYQQRRVRKPPKRTFLYLQTKELMKRRKLSANENFGRLQAETLHKVPKGKSKEYTNSSGTKTETVLMSEQGKSVPHLDGSMKEAAHLSRSVQSAHSSALVSTHSETPQGGSLEHGFLSRLLQGLKGYTRR